MLLQELFFQRSGVHAYPYGHSSFRCCSGHFPDLVLATDVAGVETQAVHTLPQSLQRKFVVKMYVRNDGKRGFSLYRTQRPGSVHVGHPEPDDFAAAFFQSSDLSCGSLDVTRVGIGHGLNRNRSAVTEGNVSYINSDRFAAFDLHGAFGKMNQFRRLPYHWS
jgi:hypothetical protein